MEMVYYKCQTCGFIHQIPEYWSGFAPDEQIELVHFNLSTGEECSEVMLGLVAK
ncbi:hypothetical protein [Alkaliphilus transvaalensis]|uniref:hypothetical protein n=1 Tax=Alkaliphilus transvaalensis TaxID=114628 RepID=UPI0012EC28E8|nr:hypothetical protein [Alkaliphilus transvaalensis]